MPTDRPALKGDDLGLGEESLKALSNVPPLLDSHIPHGRPLERMTQGRPKNLGVELSKLPDFKFGKAGVKKVDEQLSNAEKCGLRVGMSGGFVEEAIYGQDGGISSDN
jgi:hypothetical protein